MSERITRRTFLKASGAAVIAAAAGGMLAGCGGAYASTPDGLVAPAITMTPVNFDGFTASAGRFDQWTSSSIYDGGERHNYLYAAFNVNAGLGQSKVPVSTGNFSFKHSNGGTGKVVGLGYQGLNDDKTKYVFKTSLDVKAGQQSTMVLFIDLGPISTSSFSKFYQGTITLTFGKFNGQTAEFTYTGLLEEPSGKLS